MVDGTTIQYSENSIRSGDKMKSSVEWNGNNLSGFTALPGGYRLYTGEFVNRSDYKECRWWTSTNYDNHNAFFIGLDDNHIMNIDCQGEPGYTGCGYYVRCIKDLPTSEKSK